MTGSRQFDGLNSLNGTTNSEAFPGLMDQTATKRSQIPRVTRARRSPRQTLEVKTDFKTDKIGVEQAELETELVNVRKFGAKYRHAA